MFDSPSLCAPLAHRLQKFLGTETPTRDALDGIQERSVHDMHSLSGDDVNAPTAGVGAEGTNMQETEVTVGVLVGS